MCIRRRDIGELLAHYASAGRLLAGELNPREAVMDSRSARLFGGPGGPGMWMAPMSLKWA